MPLFCALRKRNTAASLSEGFAGSTHQAALATNTPWPGRPGQSKRAYEGTKEAQPNSLGRVLPLYYRCRQLMLTTEKRGRRVPQKLTTDTKALEKVRSLKRGSKQSEPRQVVAKEIRNIHPLLFQRFDDRQLDRPLEIIMILLSCRRFWPLSAFLSRGFCGRCPF